MQLRLAFALGAFAALALGQSTDATCSADFDWAKNSQGMIPCAVGSSLLAICSQTKTWVVPKLSNGNTYRGPTDTETNQCQCSTVTFSLLAACSLCQGSQPLSFADWSKSCKPEQITLDQFPFTNASVAIPLWALANTTHDGGFDLGQAKRIAGVKEPFPTVWIVVISLAIAAVFFLVFLAVFCYIRRHRVQTWMQRRRQRNSGASYAQIERKSLDSHGNPNKPKKDRRKVKPRAGHGLDLDSESGRSVYGQGGPVNGSGYLAVSGYDDPFGARVAPVPVAHQRHASASSLNLLPDHPNAGYEIATVSSGKGNHPSKVYAAGGGGGGGQQGSYSERARAQAADNAMKRSDRSGVNVITGAPPAAAAAQTTTQSSFGTATTGSLGRNAMYQDVHPAPPPPAPASHSSGRSGRSGTSAVSADTVEPFVMVSPPASTSSFPRDVKRKPQAQGHASQGSSSSLATSHRQNASASSLNLAPAAAATSAPSHSHSHSHSYSNSGGRGYEQGPSQPMFQRTKQVSSTRRDTVFDIDGTQRVRTHSDASSFELLDPATGLPKIQVSHPSPGGGEPFFGTPVALDPARRAAAQASSSSSGAGATQARTATGTGTGTGSEGGTMLTAGMIPPFGYSERGGGGSEWGGGTLISTRLGHREDQYDAMTPILPPHQPWTSAAASGSGSSSSSRRDTTDSPAPSVFAWAEQHMLEHPPSVRAPSVVDSEESHYTQRTAPQHQHQQHTHQHPYPHTQPTRSETSVSVYSQPSRGPTPLPVPPPPMPTTRSPSPYYKSDRPLPPPPPPQAQPQPQQQQERDPFATLRELAVASPDDAEPGPDSAPVVQPWGAAWPVSAPATRDRFADDYSASAYAPASATGWRR